MRKKTEAYIEKEICDYVKKWGGLALKVKVDGMRGFPDRLVIFRNKVVFVEVKTLKGRLSPQQRKCHEKLRGQGQPVMVARSLRRFQTNLRRISLGWPCK